MQISKIVDHNKGRIITKVVAFGLHISLFRGNLSRKYSHIHFNSTRGPTSLKCHGQINLACNRLLFHLICYFLLASCVKLQHKKLPESNMHGKIKNLLAGDISQSISIIQNLNIYSQYCIARNIHLCQGLINKQFGLGFRGQMAEDKVVACCDLKIFPLVCRDVCNLNF